MVRAAIFLMLFVGTQASLAFLYPFRMQRFLTVAAIYGAGTGVMLFILFHPRNQWLVANRSRVDCGGQRCVALTFDDGPSPSDTPRVLDILREKQVKATFFVVGERAERHAAIVQRARDEGHLIANHTWSHPSLFCFLTPGRLRTEIEAGAAGIERICGFRPRHFRSPVGLRHPLLQTYLRNAGIEYVSWTIRTGDTRNVSREVLARRVLSAAPGDIILLHDYREGGASALLDILPDVIDQLRDRGFQFVPVGPVPVLEASDIAVP